MLLPGSSTACRAAGRESCALKQLLNLVPELQHRREHTNDLLLATTRGNLHVSALIGLVIAHLDPDGLETVVVETDGMIENPRIRGQRLRDACGRQAGLAGVIEMLPAGKIVLRDALRVSSAGEQSGERYPSPM